MGKQFLLLSLAAILLGSLVSNVHAAPSSVTFTVNSTLDEVDKKPGDGKCLSKPSKKCTLRAAVMETNALGGSNVVILPVSGNAYMLTIAGANNDDATTGDLDIKSNLTLKGGGAGGTTINANGLDRAFHIFSLVKISGVTVQGGSVTGNTNTGGGILVASGASLKWVKSTAQNNSAVAGGGGISNLGTLRLKRSTIGPNNQSAIYGGGIYNAGTLKVSLSTLSHNQVFISISHGGAIYNGGALTVRGSTVSNNAANFGAGIYNAAGMTATFINSTIYGNAADSLTQNQNSDGGGIYNDGGNVTLAHVTLARNYGGDNATAGGIFTNGGSVILKNSLLDENTVSKLSTGDDCEGTVSTYGHNLIYGIAGCSMVLGTTDQFGVHAGLGTLANNGGPTQTAALAAASPATDAIPKAYCTDTQNHPIAVDQRGSPRPADGNNDGKKRCDIGAYELSS